MLPLCEDIQPREDYGRGILTLLSFGADSLVMLGGVYIDESGTHDGSPCFVLGGYISEPDRWLQFNREWKAALDDWDLKFFHMTDFNAFPRHKNYKHWPEKKREPRLARLFSIANRNATAAIAYGITRKDYEALSHKAREVCGSPYGLLAAGCFAVALEAAEQCGFTQLKYVFEDGADGKGDLVNAYDRMKKKGRAEEVFKISGLGFEEKQKVPPLQAADLVAYECYRRLPIQLGLKAGKRRTYTMGRIRELPCFMNYVTPEMLPLLDAGLCAESQEELDSVLNS